MNHKTIKPKPPFYEHSIRAGDWRDGFEAACTEIAKILRQRNRWGAGAIPDKTIADQIEAWDFGLVEPAAGDRRPTKLRCDMLTDCEQDVTHVDEKGYIYCQNHGILRRAEGIRARRMSGPEIRELEEGKTISYMGE